MMMLLLLFQVSFWFMHPNRTRTVLRGYWYRPYWFGPRILRFRVFVSGSWLQLQIGRVIVDDKRRMCANPVNKNIEQHIEIQNVKFSLRFHRIWLTFSKFERRNRRSKRVPFGKMNSNRMASASDGSGSVGTSKARSIFCLAISYQIQYEILFHCDLCA